MDMVDLQLWYEFGDVDGDEGREKGRKEESAAKWRFKFSRYFLLPFLPPLTLSLFSSSP